MLILSQGAGAMQRIKCVSGDSATSIAFASYLSAVDDHIRSIRENGTR